MADPREVTATLTVNFGEGAASNNDALVAEVDSRETGLNAGKTSFTPGEDVWILLYPSTNVVLNDPVTSWGDLLFRPGVEFVEKEQDLTYVDALESRVGYPMLTGFTPMFIGRDASPVAQTGELTLSIPQPTEMVMGVPTDLEHYARILRVNWTAEARAYRLTNTLIADLEEYSIIVHFTGVAS